MHGVTGRGVGDRASVSTPFFKPLLRSVTSSNDPNGPPKSDLPPLNRSRSSVRSGRKEGRMPRIKYTVEHIITKLREAEVP